MDFKVFFFHCSCNGSKHALYNVVLLCRKKWKTIFFKKNIYMILLYALISPYVPLWLCIITKEIVRWCPQILHVLFGKEIDSKSLQGFVWFKPAISNSQGVYSSTEPPSILEQCRYTIFSNSFCSGFSSVPNRHTNVKQPFLCVTH